MMHMHSSIEYTANFEASVEWEGLLNRKYVLVKLMR